MKRLFRTAFGYAIAAMAGGVFYREFTKFNGFSGRTTLGFVHTHLFLLGIIFFLVLLLLDRQFLVSEQRSFGKFFAVYNAGVVITTAAFLWRGITQVLAIALSGGMDAAISGVAGIGHILIGVGIVWYFLLLKQRIAAGEQAK